MISFFGGNCFGNETPETKTSHKEYRYFGENNQFLAEVLVSKEIIQTRVAPKIPKEISRQEAIQIWNGKKEIHLDEDCEREFLSFTDKISASKKCVKTVAKLAPTKDEPLNINIKKISTTGNSAIILLPILGITGMFALAIIFISRSAPARFMTEYCCVIIGFITLEMFVHFVNTTILFVTFSCLFCFFVHGKLIDIWLNRFPALSKEYNYNVIGDFLDAYGTLCAPIVLFAVPLWINKINTGIDYIFFISLWSIFFTVIIAVLNYFPEFRAKYLDWL